MQNVEPAFVGESRLLLVEGLVQLFDQVSSGGGPRWVSLVAPSGWGKTRVARELYARLAARQEQPAYWPESILDGVDGVDLGPVGARRKRVVPTVVHRPGSLPSYMWFGVSCSTRNGFASIALAEDLAQLRVHAPYLEDAWRESASRLARIWPRLRDTGDAILDEAASELLGAVVEGVVGAAIPGVGLVQWVAQRASGAVGDARDRKARLMGDDELAPSHVDLVAEASQMVRRLAIPGLPLVLFVEDVHLADAGTVGLISELVQSDAAVLVLTTGWPGAVGDHVELESAAALAGDRFVEVSHHGAAPSPPFPGGAGLDSLDDASLSAIVTHYYPLVDGDTSRLLVERYPNPLALEMFCQVRKYKDRFAGGNLSLPESEIAKLPTDLKGLYSELWVALPEDVRRALVVATLAIPAVIDQELGSSAEWLAPIVGSVAEQLNIGSSDEVAVSLASSAQAYAWAREVSSSLQRFIEPAQLEVALDDDSFLFEDDRRAALDVLVRLVEQVAAEELQEPAQLEGDANRSDLSPREVVHLGQLAVALHAAGELENLDVLRGAVLAVAEELEPYPLELPWVVRLCDYVMAAEVDVGATDGWPGIRYCRADASGELGRVDEAVTELEALLAEALERPEPDADDVRVLRTRLAYWLGESGREFEALDLLEEQLEVDFDVLDPRDPEMLTLMSLIATQLQDTAQYDRAVDMFELVVAGRTDVLGADAPGTLRARNNLGLALQYAGRWEESLGVLGPLLRDRTAEEGPDSPGVLSTRNNVMLAYKELGRPDVALAEAEYVAAARTRVLGPLHRKTVVSRLNLASMKGAVLGAAEACREYERLVGDIDGVLDPFLPEVLGAWHHYAYWLAESGDPALAAAIECDRVLPGRQQRLGRLHRETLASHRDAAAYLEACGREEEAATLLIEPLQDVDNSDGIDGPIDELQLVTYEVHVGSVLLRLGYVEDALEVFVLGMVDADEAQVSDAETLADLREGARIAAEFLGRTDVLDTLTSGEIPEL